MEISESSEIRRSSEVLGADVGGTHVLLSSDLEYVGLDPIGRRVWEILSEPTTWGGLVARLLSEFDVDEQACRRDVAAFVETLVEHKLVSVT